jgi:hypothetical protein
MCYGITNAPKKSQVWQSYVTATKKNANSYLVFPFDGVYPELAASLSAAEGVVEWAQFGQKKCFFAHFFVDYCLKNVKIPACLPAGKHKPPAGEDDISVCMS